MLFICWGSSRLISEVAIWVFWIGEIPSSIPVKCATRSMVVWGCLVTRLLYPIASFILSNSVVNLASNSSCKIRFWLWKTYCGSFMLCTSWLVRLVYWTSIWIGDCPWTVGEDIGASLCSSSCRYGARTPDSGVCMDCPVTITAVHRLPFSKDALSQGPNCWSVCYRVFQFASHKGQSFSPWESLPHQ